MERGFKKDMKKDKRKKISMLWGSKKIRTIIARYSSKFRRTRRVKNKKNKKKEMQSKMPN